MKGGIHFTVPPRNDRWETHTDTQTDGRVYDLRRFDVLRCNDINFNFHKDWFRIQKACGFNDIPNKYLRPFPRRHIVHVKHLFNYSLPLGHFPAHWKEGEIIILPKPGKEPKFQQKFSPVQSKNKLRKETH
jgi:hypothetical protein